MTSLEIFEMRNTEGLTEFRLVMRDNGVLFYTDAVTREALHELFEKFPIITEAFPKLIALEARTGPDAEWRVI